jgi:hypothetical protein
MKAITCMEVVAELKAIDNSLAAISRTNKPLRFNISKRIAALTKRINGDLAANVKTPDKVQVLAPSTEEQLDNSVLPDGWLMPLSITIPFGVSSDISDKEASINFAASCQTILDEGKLVPFVTSTIVCRPVPVTDLPIDEQEQLAMDNLPEGEEDGQQEKSEDTSPESKAAQASDTTQGATGKSGSGEGTSATDPTLKDNPVGKIGLGNLRKK